VWYNVIDPLFPKPGEVPGFFYFDVFFKSKLHNLKTGRQKRIISYVLKGDDRIEVFIYHNRSMQRHFNGYDQMV
jgi:hypothetical protein